MSEPFNQKLSLVLKVLSMSRARLAADLCIDKSVIGRWVRGDVRPSAHNLARMSALVQERIPGFTSLDWDRDLDSLARLCGVDRGGSPPPPRINLSAGLPLPLLAQMLANTAMHGPVYEGFYRSTRPYASKPGHFVHDHCLVWKDETGLLRIHQSTGGVFVDGWILPLQRHLFIIGVEFTSPSLVFAVLHAAQGARAEVLDGLILSVAFDPEHTPTTSAVVFERIGELSGDRATDEARFAELAGSAWSSPAEAVAELLRDHLTHDTGKAQLALGGDWLMRMPLSRSFTRGASTA